MQGLTGTEPNNTQNRFPHGDDTTRANKGFNGTPGDLGGQGAGGVEMRPAPSITLQLHVSSATTSPVASAGARVMGSPSLPCHHANTLHCPTTSSSHSWIQSSVGFLQSWCHPKFKYFGIYFLSHGRVVNCINNLLILSFFIQKTHQFMSSVRKTKVTNPSRL